jgi:riboflavin synthase
VEELGRVRSREGGRFEVEAKVVMDGLAVGDSVAHNGVCLTVVALGEGWYAVDAVDETLSRSNLDDVRAGDDVNLERPLRLADRLGGHLVQGHVDGVGTVTQAAPDLRIAVPPDIARYLVVKGSITVDGCSLTVVDALPTEFSVAVIPHTAAVTTLGRRRPGDRVNLEVDVLAKYVEKLLSPQESPSASPPASPPAPPPAPDRS